MVGSNGSVVDEGNTNSSSTKNAVKRQSGSYRWQFTWSNYSQDWVARLAPCFEGSVGWIGGYEIAPTTGTPHIQGYVEFKSKVRPVGYKGAPKEIHWGDKYGKPCNGDRACNVAYCVKEGRGYEGTFKPPRPLPVITMRGWQHDVVKKQEAPVIQRKIYWYWSDARGVGKSDAVRWLATQGALICGGKAADMKYLIVKYHEKNGDYPETVVMDVPCSLQHYLSYSGIEEVVNGVFPSTKYECEPVIMPYTRFFLFANFPPALDDVDMSANRFITFNIDEYLETHGPMDDHVEQKKRSREYTDDELLDF